MDQLSVHKHFAVKPVYEELEITPIYNVGYSPEFNCIESCFSQVKRNYILERLNSLANDLYFDPTTEIRKAFRVVTPELVQACLRMSEAKLNELL